MKEKLHFECPDVSGCDYLWFKREVGAHVRSSFPWLYARYRSLLKHDKFPFMWRDDEVSMENAQIHRESSKPDLGFLDHHMFDPYGYELEEDGEDREDEDDGEDEKDGEDGEDEGMDVGSKHPRSGMDFYHLYLHCISDSQSFIQMMELPHRLEQREPV